MIAVMVDGAALHIGSRPRKEAGALPHALFRSAGGWGTCGGGVAAAAGSVVGD